jgi:nucleoid-associated protein YgaU
VLPDKDSRSAVVVPKITTATVVRGDSLWRLSRRSLGGGERYAVIYQANREQIRNPNLIYPGQVLVMPSRETQR